MTGNTPGTRPGPDHNDTARAYFEHSSAKRSDTDIVVVEALRAEYPKLHLTVVPQWNCNLAAFAGSGRASLVPMDKENERLSWRFYLPAARRVDNQHGFLGDAILLAKFMLQWQGQDFIVLLAETDGRVQQYILSADVQATNNLLLETGSWLGSLHNEIWVYDGYWRKSAELWASVQDSYWDDVILDETMKAAIIAEVETFFASRDIYKRLGISWKRGIIYHGPPGNGKTISIKAMMNSLSKRADPIPTLYVKSIYSSYSIDDIFNKARQVAPCYLVFEDLDSLVNGSTRSYFLNTVDGVAKNDGILMIGSTNHLDRLDPGIAKRPSRFDRKYLFPNPNEEQRTAYMRYWQKKLPDNDIVEFPDKLCPAIAKITSGFSFAYMQEAIMASLLIIARDQDQYVPRTCLECLEAHEKPENGSMCDRSIKRPLLVLDNWVWSCRQVDEDDPDLDNYVLWREIKKQIRILREDLDEEHHE